MLIEKRATYMQRVLRALPTSQPGAGVLKLIEIPFPPKQSFRRMKIRITILLPLVSNRRVSPVRLLCGRKTEE